MKHVTDQTFKSMNFDQWFMLISTLVIGIGLIILAATIYNSIKIKEIQMNKYLQIIDKETNQPWNVKILEQGDAYGLDNCLTHDGVEPLVEFYDGRYIENFGILGQFVSRYYVETILEGNNTGLNLHGGVESWSIGHEGMKEVRDFLRHEYNQFNNPELRRLRELNA